MGNSLTPQIENARKTGVCSLNGKGFKEVSRVCFILFSSLSRFLTSSSNICCSITNTLEFVIFIEVFIY